MKRISHLSFVFLFLLSLSIAYSQSAATPLHEIRLNETVHTIAWSPDGTLIAVGSDAGLSIFDHTLALLSRPQETLNIVSLDWSPDSQYLAAATGSFDNGIEVWQRLPDNTFLLDHLIHYDTSDYIERSFKVRSVKWSPDGQKLAVMNEEFECCANAYFGSIEAWDTKSWTRLSTSKERFLFTNEYSGRPYPERPSSYDVAWSEDGQLIAGTGRWNCRDEFSCVNPFGGSYGGIFLIDAETGEITDAVATAGHYGEQSLAWDGKHPLASGSEHGIVLHDPLTLTLLYSFDSPDFANGGIPYPMNPSGIFPLVWSPNDPRLIFPSYGITILDVETNTCQIIDVYDQQESRETAIDVVFDGSQLIVSFSFQDQDMTSAIRIWQIPPRSEDSEPCNSIP